VLGWRLVRVGEVARVDKEALNREVVVRLGKLWQGEEGDVSHGAK